LAPMTKLRRNHRAATGRNLCLGFILAFSWVEPTLALQASPNGEAVADVAVKAKRKLGKVSKPADFTGAGLLQLEYGYDGDFRAPGVDADQLGTISLLFNATEDFQLELDFDTFHARTSELDQTDIGIGDSDASAQLTTASESQYWPALAFAYRVKFPTADENAGLGSGRVDHKGTILASKRWGTADVDFAASLLINGDSEADGWDTGCQLALGFTHPLRVPFSLQAEIFGETLDTDQPQGLFVQGALVHQPNGRTSFDVGARVGLTSEAPRFGVFAGVSFSLGNAYEGF
jgi:hypothetical protein